MFRLMGQKTATTTTTTSTTTTTNKYDKRSSELLQMLHWPVTHHLIGPASDIIFIYIKHNGFSPFSSINHNTYNSI